MAESRLDVRVADHLQVTRSRAEKLIRDGQVQVNGIVVTKPGYKVDASAYIQAEVPPPVAMSTAPEPLPLCILYEDAHLAVIDKPVGMVVHPAAGNPSGTLVNALLYHLRDLSGIGGTLRPGIVHRLDKDTSGLLLVAKDDATHLALSEALKARRIQKTYQAVAIGSFRQDAGEINAPIGRHASDRKRMAIRMDGRDALTRYRVVQPLRGATLLQVDLITGRTHQIRVHFAHLGHPLVGDPVYGGRKPAVAAARLMLHAWRISLEHPISGEPLHVESPLPDDFTAVLARLSPACTS